MKTFKKITTIPLFFLMMVLLMFNSCIEDEPNSGEIQIAENFKSISFDNEYYNSIISKEENVRSEDHIYYSKTKKRFINTAKTNVTENSNDLYSILVSFTKVSETNLNNLVSTFPDSVNITALTLVRNSENILNGLIIHYLDSSNNFKVKIFEKEMNSDAFALVEFDAEKVDNYTLDNILFIAKTIFPEHDIEAIGIQGIQNIVPNNEYNDIELLDFAYRYGYAKGSGFPPSIDPGGDTRPCGLTHHCQNGNDVRTNCQPFAQGCQQAPDCSKKSSADAMTHNSMFTEYHIYTTNLPDNDLYSVRDFLNTTDEGKFYVEAYYAISRHFKSSLDVEILYKITTASPEIGSFIQAFLNDDSNYILTEDVYNSIIEIAQTSANGSESDLYKDVIDAIINTTNKFKNKNISEIKNLLN